jgi:hypothetical protein
LATKVLIFSNNGSNIPHRLGKLWFADCSDAEPDGGRALKPLESN